MRAAFWVGVGVVLGLMIHLVIILALPRYAGENVWAHVGALGADGQVVVLAPVQAHAPNPLGLDPKLAYAVCRLDLRQGPGFVAGVLPQAFWSVSVFNKAGIALYSTTNRAGIGEVLDIGVFNPEQTQLLAQQQVDIPQGLLIVESPDDDIFVTVRLAPAHEVMAARYRQVLDSLECGNLEVE